MAVPKKKISSSRRGMRRSHDALKAINITFDKDTGEAKLPHNISMIDGYYNGKQVFVPKAKKTAEEKQEATEEENKS